MLIVAGLVQWLVIMVVVGLFAFLGRGYSNRVGSVPLRFVAGAAGNLPLHRSGLQETP